MVGNPHLNINHKPYVHYPVVYSSDLSEIVEWNGAMGYDFDKDGVIDLIQCYSLGDHTFLGATWYEDRNSE